MNSQLKCGVSAVALLAAISFAHAQTNERQGGGASAGTERSSGERGETSKSSPASGEKGSATGQQHQGKAADERGQTGSQQKGRSAEERSDQKGRAVEERGKTGEQKGRTAEEQKGSQRQGRSAEESQQKGRDTRTENERDGKSQQTTTSQQRNESGRSAQGSDRNRETDVNGRAEARNDRQGERSRVNINVTPEQKTRIHEFVQRDSGIRRYRRSDIQFSVNVGTRIPDTITFYDPPPQFVDIDPEFRRYKIIVLDDEVLVVDPETREIVDVIQT
jgi:hypothetical protein